MSDVLYSAVVLDGQSKQKLINEFGQYFPEEWKVYAHHQTINLGDINPEYERYLGMKVKLRVEELGISDKAIAVKVSGFYTMNKIPHVTLAVNVNEGGKPVMSNQITNWQPVDNKFDIFGIVEEIKKR